MKVSFSDSKENLGNFPEEAQTPLRSIGLPAHAVHILALNP